MTTEPQDESPEDDALRAEAAVTETTMPPEIEERLANPGESRQISLNDLRYRVARRRAEQE